MMIQDRPEFSSKPKPLAFPPTATVASAVAEMSRLNYGSVVVVDSSDKPIGMVTERDLMKRVLNEHRDPSTTELTEIMTSEPRVAKEDDEIRDWLRIMSNERFRRLPVVDREGRLTAMMTQGDFVSYTWPDLFHQATEMTKATISDNRQVAIIAAGIGAYTLLVMLAIRFV